MLAFVIDDAGTIWELANARRTGKLSSSLPDNELLSYVARNAGYVALQRMRGAIWIRLRPAIVDQKALAALMYFLFDHPTDRIAIGFFWNGWHEEVYGSRQAAVERLAAILTQQQNPRAADFVRRTESFTSLPRTEPMARWWERWRGLSTRATAREISRMLSEDSGNRSVLVAVGADLSRPRFTYLAVGQDINIFDARWRRNAVGRPVEHMPDYYYGKWTVEAFGEVARTREPRLEDLDVIIRPPWQRPTRTTYKRILFPLRDTRGTHLLLGHTMFDETIDLRDSTARDGGEIVQDL